MFSCSLQSVFQDLVHKGPSQIFHDKLLLVLSGEVLIDNCIHLDYTIGLVSFVHEHSDVFEENLMQNVNLPLPFSTPLSCILYPTSDVIDDFINVGLAIYPLLEIAVHIYIRQPEPPDLNHLAARSQVLAFLHLGVDSTNPQELLGVELLRVTNGEVFTNKSTLRKGEFDRAKAAILPKHSHVKLSDQALRTSIQHTFET
mmetsp:Transcript_154206/g.280078  ORF Transcript_154206/g.280078 Transcript_154206/m.280078 type:complete len:200 (+) Transcript_154206:181-780(+)